MSDKQGMVQKVLTDAFGTGDENPGYLYFDPKFMKHPLYKKAQDFTNGVYQGFTTGFSDELSGLGRGAVYGVGDWFRGSDDGNDTFVDRFKRGYQEGRDLSRKEYAASMNRSPFLTTTGEFAGTFSNPILNKNLAKNWQYLNEMDTFYRQTARLLPPVMGYGGLFGIGKSEGETIPQVGADGVIGAVSAAPFAAMGPAISRSVNQARILNGKRLFKKSLEDARYKELDFHVPSETYMNSSNPLERMGRIPESMVKRNEQGIYFGRVSKSKLDAINRARLSKKLEPIADNRVFISPRAQHHIYEQRIVDNGKTPEFVADRLHSAVHKSSDLVYPGRYDDVQALFYPGNKYAKGVYMGINNVSGKWGPFSTYNLEMRRLRKLKPFE